MKQLLTTIIICLCALAMVDFSRADGPRAYIEWTYINPPTDLAGFHIYINDSLVQDLNVPTATSWSGPVTLIDGGNNTFELTAYDIAGQESIKSTPFIVFYDIPPNEPVITTITIDLGDK